MAVGALAAACTTAAFADEYVKAEYKDGKVTLSGFGEYAEKADGDLTLLILSEDATEITADNANTVIKQIDQFNITDGNYTKEVTVGDLDTTKTYYVRLGGAAANVVTEKGFVSTTFGGTTGPEKVLVGDANGDGNITLNDCTEICKYYGGKIGDIRTAITDEGDVVNTKNFLAAAFSNGDKNITLNDCTEICKQYAGKTVDHVGKEEYMNQYDDIAE